MHVAEFFIGPPTARGFRYPAPACDIVRKHEFEVMGKFREISGIGRIAMHRQFILGQFSFDTRTGALRRDRDQINLTPRAAAVLSMLAERAEHLVTKQELRSEE